MTVDFELSQLMNRARADKALRDELLQTRSSNDPIGEFCKKCTELGYSHITVYELLTAGEAFCATMLRSVNGGGVEAPDQWDDFYEMFFDELKSIS